MSLTSLTLTSSLQEIQGVENKTNDTMRKQSDKPRFNKSQVCKTKRPDFVTEKKRTLGLKQNETQHGLD